DHARAHECLSELPLSFRRKTRLRSDNYLREPPRRKNVRTLRVQGSEPSGDHQIQSALSRIGLSQHGYQELGDCRSAFRLLTRSRVTRNLGRNRSGVPHRFTGSVKNSSILWKRLTQSNPANYAGVGKAPVWE